MTALFALLFMALVGFFVYREAGPVTAITVSLILLAQLVQQGSVAIAEEESAARRERSEQEAQQQ